MNKTHTEIIKEFREKFTMKLKTENGTWTTMKTGIVPSGMEEWLKEAFKEIEGDFVKTFNEGLKRELIKREKEIYLNDPNPEMRKLAGSVLEKIDPNFRKGEIHKRLTKAGYPSLGNLLDPEQPESGQECIVYSGGSHCHCHDKGGICTSNMTYCNHCSPAPVEWEKEFRRDLNNNRFHLHGYVNDTLLIDRINKILQSEREKVLDEVERKVIMQSSTLAQCEGELMGMHEGITMLHGKVQWESVSKALLELSKKLNKVQKALAEMRGSE